MLSVTPAPLCTEAAVPTLLGSALYHSLVRYFDNHLIPLQKVSIYVNYSVYHLLKSVFSLLVLRWQTSDSLHDEALLQYFAAEWARYTTGAHSVNRLFTHLNNLWIKRERDEGRKSIYPVYEVYSPHTPST